jgi:hypothetical protein
MQKSKFLSLALSAAMCMMLGANISVAADQAQAQQKTQAKPQKPEVIYGSQLMTKKERAEHRTKMRSLKTKEEREAFRAEHHQKMQERAKEIGKTLPDMPPAQGSGACGGAVCGGTGGCCGGMHGGMKHDGAGSKKGAACGTGCCGGGTGCCGGMHGGAESKDGAACGTGGCCGGGMHGGMKHGEAGQGMACGGSGCCGGCCGGMHGGKQPSETTPNSGVEPQSGAASDDHSHH